MSSSNLRLRCTIREGSCFPSRRNASFTPDTNTSSHTTTRAGEPCNRRVQTPRTRRPARNLRTRTGPKPRSFRQTTSERLDGDRRRLGRHRGFPRMPPPPRPPALGLSPIRYIPCAAAALPHKHIAHINRGASRSLLSTHRFAASVHITAAHHKPWGVPLTPRTHPLSDLSLLNPSPRIVPLEPSPRPASAHPAHTPEPVPVQDSVALAQTHDAAQRIRRNFRVAANSSTNRRAARQLHSRKPWGVPLTRPSSNFGVLAIKVLPATYSHI